MNLKRWILAGATVALCAASRSEDVTTTPLMRYGTNGKLYEKSGLASTNADATTPSLTFEGDEVPTVTDFVGEDGAVVTTDGRTVTVSASGALDSSEVTTGEDEPLTATVSLGTVEIVTTGGAFRVDPVLVFDGDVDNEVAPLPYDDVLGGDLIANPASPLKVNLGYNTQVLNEDGVFVGTMYKKPDGGGFLEFWDNAPDVDRKVSQIGNNGALVVYDGTGTVVGSYGDSCGAKNGIGTDADIRVGGATYNAIDDEGLWFGITGSVNAIYGMFKDDIHTLKELYASGGAVLGRGRQYLFSQKGLVISSEEGAEGTPLVGSQMTLVHTNEDGTHFVNNHAQTSYHGSGSKAFNFDWDVRTSGTLVSESTTSSLVLAGNAVVAGSVTAASFSGDLAAGDLASGTVPDARLDTNIPRVVARGPEEIIAIATDSLAVSAPDIALGDTVIATYSAGSNGGGAMWVDSITSGVGFMLYTTNTVGDDTAIHYMVLR